MSDFSSPYLLHTCRLTGNTVFSLLCIRFTFLFQNPSSSARTAVWLAQTSTSWNVSRSLTVLPPSLFPLSLSSLPPSSPSHSPPSLSLPPLTLLPPSLFPLSLSSLPPSSSSHSPPSLSGKDISWRHSAQLLPLWASCYLCCHGDDPGAAALCWLASSRFGKFWQTRWLQQETGLLLMSRETKRERIIAEIKERVEDNGYQAFIIWLGNN